LRGLGVEVETDVVRGDDGGRAGDDGPVTIVLDA
jgi:hypothetical protein